MSDNFPILIETEENAVGSVLRVLHKTPGIVGIHLQLEASAAASAAGVKQLTSPQMPKVPAVKKRVGNRYTNDNRGGVSNLIAQALMKAPLHFSILRPILERSGYSAKSLNSAITGMAFQKEVVRIAPGTYRLTVKGQRKYDKGGAMQAASGSLDKRTGLRPLILEEMASRGGSIEHEELKKFLVSKGFSDSNMYNMVPKMRESGLIVRYGDTYSITERGNSFLNEGGKNDEQGMVEKSIPAIEDKSLENNG